ncbi:MAG: ribonuclease III [bacterium]|nr:ribonuclease III [bacterium]
MARRRRRRLQPRTQAPAGQPTGGRWKLAPDPNLVLRPGRLEPAPAPEAEDEQEEPGADTQEPDSKRLPATARRALAGLMGLDLVGQAFTHASFANENPERAAGDNERLEFLGDAVLGTCISDYLVRQYPGWSEGELTRIRAAVVCEPTLARRAAALGLGDCLRLGKGEASGGGRAKPSILAAAFEALVGAIYLEAGLERAAAFILKELRPEVDAAVRGDLPPDYKTLLQQAAQQEGHLLEYRLVGESGPDHQPLFTVTVMLGGLQTGEGSGRSKKEAEQAAAAAALSALERRERPPSS